MSGAVEPRAATSQPWWSTAVVYQVYPRSFADGDGDGVGDLRGVIDRLDHLVDLGVDVLWLCPVYPSPQDDNGYDVSDYRDVDPVFGSLDDLDELLREAHARGLRLILDLVVNHTSDEHPWFVESRDPGSPKRDWYWWRPARPGHEAGTPGAEPNNWGSRFSGSAWQYDERSGEYYLHLYSRKQPDLNWENPDVRRAVHDLMRWWLDRGVDGFRMDVINFISKDPALPDAPVPPGALHGRGEDHFVSGPRLHEFLQEMHREVLAERPDRLLTVGETPGATVEEARLLTDPARGELDMVFQFEHVDLDAGRDRWDVRPLHLPDLKASLSTWQRELADTGWNSLYLNNHDQPRVLSRWGDDGTHRVESAKLFATVLHLHRGTPFVYQGEEIGMANYPFSSVAELRDVQSLGYHREATEVRGLPVDLVLESLRRRSRDNARTPMQWDASPEAGFTTGTPWLAVNPDHVTVNVAAQVDDPASVLAHYRALIRLRHTDPLVVDGRFELLLPDDETLYAFTRVDGPAGLLVLANVSGAEVPVPGEAVEPWQGSRLVLGSHERTPPRLTGALRLLPWESRVYRRG